MFKVLLVKKHIKLFFLLCLLFSVSSKGVFAGGPRIKSGVDLRRYITVDEVRRGQEAYCLTVFEGTKVEKFALEVLSVVENYRPGLDGILVVGTDERFKKTGAVRGCSGSPVYIEGRLAGALSQGWSYAKDPLYFVTPIEYMLQVGSSYETQAGDSKSQTPPRIKSGVTLAFDFSKPIRLNPKKGNPSLFPGVSTLNNSMSGSLMPLITSLPESVCDDLAEWFEPLGLIPIAAGSANSQLTTQNSKPTFEPGSVLTIPLLSGDLSMAVIGAVTEVVDNKVYGFGHNFLGYGAVDLPMATGYVHTVVSNMIFSFKLATAGRISGAIRFDESTGIYGEIGAQAKMIPIKINVERYNDPQKRTYNCELAYDRSYTPLIVQTALIGASRMRGPLPPEHLLKYKASISVETTANLSHPVVISFENISSGQSFGEFVSEAAGPVALLMNNPYSKVDITSLNFEVQILPENKLSNIWSATLSDTKARPGETIDVTVVLQSYMSEKTLITMKLKIPAHLAPGEYKITIAGAYGYEKFLRKNEPHKFMSQNLSTLIEAINNIVSIRRDRLYLTMTLPSGGVVIQQAELPDLPQTKSLLLQSPKRTIKTQPYRHWVEESIGIDTVVLNRKIMTITIER